MNLAELLATKAALEVEIAKAKKSEATSALRRVQELVTEFGFTSQKGFPLLLVKEKKHGVAKYRDQSTDATWTGRGKPPAWTMGKNRDEFLIADSAPLDGPFLAEMAAAANPNSR